MYTRLQGVCLDDLYVTSFNVFFSMKNKRFENKIPTGMIPSKFSLDWYSLYNTFIYIYNFNAK